MGTAVVVCPGGGYRRLAVAGEGSRLVWRLNAVGVSAEIHLYEKGAHGFGTKAGLGPTSEWPARLEEWLRAHGWLDPPA